MAFQELLEEAGCQLDSSTVVFGVEPVLFRRALGIKLRSRSNGFEEFSQDLQTFTEDPKVFRKFLLPSTLAENVPKTSRTSSLESLFKSLLAIDSVQPELITYLLERLPEFYDELENDNSSSCTARLILHQLRWLDYIAQPEVLTGKLIEIIQITPPLIQHEIITSLPDIVNDSEHKPIVVYLKELMNENSELTVPILDALSNLTLHSESLDDVRETVLDRLESAELDDLAVIVKFMLQTVTPSTIDMVVYGIRQKLDFRTLGKIQQQTSTQRAKTKDASEALILESIKLGLQFHKFVCDSWMKSIVAIESQREHKVIDLLVLIILYSMTSMKKKLEAIIKKKIIQGKITAALIQETIEFHADGLVGYWGTLLSLSESLLRSCQQNSAISPCASALYINSFKSSDVYYRQEIIGALVTHIGSGVEAEMNVALNVLFQLVKSNVSSVAVYSVFVKGILDYLDNLNVYQIRTLFDIFSLLALTTGSTSDGSRALWNEIAIVIRKQLSNPREKYKNIGIIASISAVKILGNRKLCNDQNDAGSSSISGRSSQANNVVRHPLLSIATSLLDTVVRSTREHPNCLALLYDEMAHIITEEDTDERLQTWMRENMVLDFTEYFVVSEGDADIFIQQAENNQYLKLEPEKHMNLDGEECQIIVKMYNLIYKVEMKDKKNLLVPMCSIFNLMQSSEKSLNDGSLQDIDALFGCGILLFKAEDLEEISLDETEYACDMLFYTINWFKEILNAFMYNTEENYRVRLITRLRNILQLEQFLSKLMDKVPNYAPLEFHATMPAASALNKNNGGASQINSTPCSVESQRSQDAANADPALSHKVVKKDYKTNSITFGSVSNLRPYMRPFYVHILELLKYNVEVQDDAEKMTYDEINYILEDLNLKLDIKIVPPPPAFFGKKKATPEDKYSSCNSIFLTRMDSQSLVTKVIAFLPHILQTLENTYVGTQSRDIEPGRIEGLQDIAHTISHIFNILYKLLSWPEIQNFDNVEVLQEIIYCIAQRISGDGKQKNKSSPETELGQAFHYLSQYGDNIPEAKTAVLLFKILQRLMAISENPSPLKRTASKVVHQIITTAWFDWREIKKEIPFLIEEWISLSDDPLDVLHDFINCILPRFEQEDQLEDYPLLKTETVVQHYQAVITQTVKAFDALKYTDQEAELVLVQTARNVKIFERITNYVKVKEDRVLLGVLLKTGRSYIDQFLKHSIPFFTDVFKAHSASIHSILKDFQASTRMIQIICSHVKVLKEVQLSSYVPPMKKSLETVIYQVKMLLIENRISSNAFFMGALKHRDIRGAEVSSQIPRQEEDSEEEDDELNEADEDDAAVDDEEGDESTDNARVQKKKRTSKKAAAPPKQAKKRSTTAGPSKKKAPRKSKISNSVTALKYRTSSQVPSSADNDSKDEEEQENQIEEEEEESDEDEAVVIHASSNEKRKIEPVEEEAEEDEEEEEEEEMIEINPSSSDNDDEEEENHEAEDMNIDEEDDDMPPEIPSSPSPPRRPNRRQKEQPAKKRRLGLGSFKSSQKKIFNLTKCSGQESD